MADLPRVGRISSGKLDDYGMILIDMLHRKNVIKGLEHCFHGQECCGDTECPYFIEHLSDGCCLEDCQENLKADVIALLNEQDEEIKRLKGELHGFGDLFQALSEKTESVIDEQQKIVLCKDCKYCSSEIRDGIQFAKCELKHNWMPQAEWFCADGERREGR